MASEYRDVHAAADVREPKLAAAFLRSAVRMRRAVSVRKLTAALATGNVKAALKQLREIEAALEPVEAVVQKTVLRGGRVGAERIPKKRVTS